MTGLCLVVAGVLRATLPAQEFTLAWTHSVEKIRWEEDYRVERDAILLVSARVRGSGAGMEPPANAVLRDGVWHYRPERPALSGLRITLSPYSSDYDLCWNEQCAPVTRVVGLARPEGVVELVACPSGVHTAPPAAVGRAR